MVHSLEEPTIKNRRKKPSTNQTFRKKMNRRDRLLEGKVGGKVMLISKTSPEYSIRTAR